ncbi:hypothetical protein LPJ61_000849 [Coemansia biformis]|uniref:ER membrane protein complex subunit 1 n=1 Tax=Coemansia biformis TaxID=1286918 RepID=A0A9W7YGB6_9FUNG|nr:hypothetical protein LPJ61_000849 [Coemansia biformis]
MVAGRSLGRAALSAALLLGGLAFGLFPDEAGRIDWYRAQIGVPDRLLAHAHNGTTGIYATTEQGVLAAVDADSGELRWRQLLGEHIGALQLRGGRVLTQSGANESRVRVWDAHSGSLQWEFVQPPPARRAAGGAAAFVGDSEDVVAVAGDSLVRLAPGRAVPVWELRLNSTGTYRRLVVHGSSAFAVGERADGGGLRVVEAELASGRLQKQYDIADGVALGTGHTLVLDAGAHGVYVLWREAKSIVWQIHKLGLTRPLWDMYHAKLLQEELAPEDMLTSTLAELDSDSGSSTGTPRFALTYTKDRARKTVVIELIATSDRMDMRKLTVFRSDGAVVGGSAMPGARGAAVAVRTSGATWSVHGDGARAAKGEFAYAEAAHGPVVRAALYRTAAGSTRVLVQTGGGLLAALGPDSSEPLWVRDEALAHATDMAFLDLPPPASAAEHAAKATDPAVVTSAAARYLLRWAATARELGAWTAAGFGLLEQRDKAAHAAAATTGDHFGFHKLAIFGTRTGVVTALGTQGGARVWARYLAVDGASVAIEHVFVTRRCQPLGDAPPVVVVVGRGAQNATVVAALDALTGAPLADGRLRPLPFGHARAFVLPAVGDDGQQLVGLATDGAEPRLEVWPPTAAATQAFCAAATPFFFELGDGTGSMRVRGYRAECPAAAGTSLTTTRAWTFDLPEGEALVGAARYDGAQSTALLGRVLGDRSVLYKYINPHLGTLAAQRAGRGGVAVYLFDRVSGRLLHSAQHAAARVSAAHPFLATQTENRIVYQLWHDEIPGAAPARGYVTVVADLFESDRADVRDERAEFSSLDLRLPSVVMAAFVAPEPATALGTTRTASHITTRDVVFALSSGKLLAIPDPLLDPRRPVGALSADEQAEGLVPYMASLPLDPRRVLSHGHRVAGVRRVVSAPAHLESTSLVGAYGLDLFFTRASPSGTFDQLSPSFSKLNLVVTTLALAAGCLLGGPMVRRRLVARAWA